MHSLRTSDERTAGQQSRSPGQLTFFRVRNRKPTGVLTDWLAVRSPAHGYRSSVGTPSAAGYGHPA